MRYPWKTVPQLLGRKVGQEAELAEIHSEHRRLLIPHLPRSTQDGPVAPEHERQVGLQPAQVHFLREVDGDDLAVGAQERQEAICRLAHSWPRCIAQNEDLQSGAVYSRARSPCNFFARSSLTV